MGYSNSSAPFWVGTAIFILLGVLSCFISAQCHKRGKNPELGYTPHDTYTYTYTPSHCLSTLSIYSYVCIYVCLYVCPS